MGLWRWGRLVDFWPRSGRHEADCLQCHSPSPHGDSPCEKHKPPTKAQRKPLKAASKKFGRKKRGTFMCSPVLASSEINDLDAIVGAQERTRTSTPLSAST